MLIIRNHLLSIRKPLYKLMNFNCEQHWAQHRYFVPSSGPVSTWCRLVADSMENPIKCWIVCAVMHLTWGPKPRINEVITMVMKLSIVEHSALEWSPMQLWTAQAIVECIRSHWDWWVIKIICKAFQWNMFWLPRDYHHHCLPSLITIGTHCQWQIRGIIIIDHGSHTRTLH